MRRLAGGVLVLFVAMACGGSTAETPSPAAPTATTAAAPETTSAPAEDATTTPPATPTGPTFFLSRIGLGIVAQVVVFNQGPDAGSLAGYFLCSDGLYYEFPDVVVPPGEMAAVSVTGRDEEIFDPPSDAIAMEPLADIGPFDPVSGEVGLYRGDNFADPGSIVSYVEWGESGHQRSEVAVSAGIWTAGGFVPTTEQSGGIFATRMPSRGPQDWGGG